MVYFNTEDAPSEVGENDALPLEYKRQNRHLLKQANISDFVGDAALECFICSDILHFEKQGIHILGGQIGMPDHDISD